VKRLDTRCLRMQYANNCAGLFTFIELYGTMYPTTENGMIEVTAFESFKFNRTVCDAD
jgi:hypothetical protein